MPDPRRICGPDDAIEPPVLRSTDHKVPPPEAIINGKRKDGRSWDELRPLFMKVGIVTKAQGSAYIEMGETKLICAVYGPREVLKREEFSLEGKVSCEFKYMPFSRKAYSEPKQNFEEKMLSKTISDALKGVVMLEKFPKAQIDISVQVVQDGGSTLSLAITAASAALTNAGIEMKDMVIGCTLRCFTDQTMVVDPTIDEMFGVCSKYNGGAGLLMAVLPSLAQISTLKQWGRIEQEQVKEGIESCWEACLRLATAVKTVLIESLSDKTTSIT